MELLECVLMAFCNYSHFAGALRIMQSRNVLERMFRISFDNGLNYFMSAYTFRYIRNLLYIESAKSLPALFGTLRECFEELVAHVLNPVMLAPKKGMVIPHVSTPACNLNASKLLRTIINILR